MTEINLGVVAPVSMGAWQSDREYQELSIITHANSIFIAKAQVPVNTPPLTGNSWGSYWDKLIEYPEIQLTKLDYPIGSIFISTGISPAVEFGGTWEQIQERFLLGSSSNYSVSATGGEAQHILTVDEMPEHNHMEAVWSSNAMRPITNGHSNENGVYGPQLAIGGVDMMSNGITTYNTGRSQPHNNMPPYLVVDIWRRIA